MHREVKADFSKECHYCQGSGHWKYECSVLRAKGIFSTLFNVREHPPEMYKNEWEVIGTGQTIYTVSNTTHVHLQYVSIGIYHHEFVMLKKMQKCKIDWPDENRMAGQ